MVPEVQTADSCFGLIGPRQCSAALGGHGQQILCAMGSQSVPIQQTSLYNHLY